MKNPGFLSSERTLRWREMDSNYWYRGTKAVDFRSIPGIAGVSAGRRLLVGLRQKTTDLSGGILQ